MRIWIVLPRPGCPFLFGFLLFLTACSAPKQPSVEDLTHKEDFAGAKMMSLQGARDGASVKAVAMFSGRSLLLTVEMEFAIGAPTTLMSGTWLRSRADGSAETGSVFARSVDFAGGQGGSPSVGGTFDLVDSAGIHKYRVVIPLLELKR